MTPTSQGLEFSTTPTTLAVGISFLVLISGLAYLSAQRSKFRRGPVLVECLRILIAIGIALTLLQPEWKQTFLPEEKPTLAVLVDSSGSMETRDVMEFTGSPETVAFSRAKHVAHLTRPDTWAPLEPRLKVVISTFNSELPAHPEEATDLRSALEALPEKHSQLGAVVLISDGDWNIGGPPSGAAAQLRMAKVPVFALAAGSPDALPDIELTSFEVPVFAVTGKPLRIPYTLLSTLPRDEIVTLELATSGGAVTTHQILVPAMESTRDTILWRPSRKGKLDLTLLAPRTGGELYTENNTLTASVDVREEELRVLVLETYPRWEYRYLRNALQRDPGVEVDCLLLHPEISSPASGPGYLNHFPDDAALSTYDVVFLGDLGLAPGQLKQSQATSLRRLVHDQASGLIFLPGFRGFQHTLLGSDLEELIPVVLDPSQPGGWGTPVPGRFTLTEAGTRSLLTRLEDDGESSTLAWSALPGFHWYAPALRAKAGTEVLATHGNDSTRFGRVPLLVSRTFGAGKVLYMGSDGAWRWRKGVEDRYHYRFWGQVVRWMAYQRNIASSDRMRLFYSPDRPRSNETITLNANVMSAAGEPLREGKVIAEITSPSGSISSIRLSPAGEEAWGLFSGIFKPTEGGTHQLRLSSAESASHLDAEIPVQSTPLEQRGRPARHDVLKEIAQLTRGQFLLTSEAAKVITALDSLPEPGPEIRRVPLWAHPAWAATLLLLLSTFWILRKRLGMF